MNNNVNNFEVLNSGNNKIEVVDAPLNLNSCEGKTSQEFSYFMSVPEYMEMYNFGGLKWQCYYIVHSILHRHYRFKDDDGWVPIAKEFMTSVIGSNYHKVIKKLKSLGIIEVDDRFHFDQTGKTKSYSKKYRLVMRSEKVTRIKCGSPYMIKKLQDLRRGVDKTWNNGNVDMEMYDYIVDCMNSVGLRDKDGLIYDLKQQYKQLNDSDNIIDNISYDSIFSNVNNIIDKQFFHTVCDYGRLHTNFTNCPKTVRRHLTIDGCNTSSIDIKNSQPVFLFITLQSEINHIKSSHLTQPSIPSPISGHLCIVDDIANNKIMYNDNTKEVGGSSSSIPSPISGHLWDTHELVAADLELQELHKLVTTGTIYEWIVESILFETGEEIERSEAKRLLFKQVLFCHNNDMKGLVYDYFELHFPKLTRLIKQLKKNNYKQLARNMQMKEAKLIFNHICFRLKHHKIKAVTVHDCVIVKQEEASKVLCIMQEEFKKINIDVKLSIE